MGRRYVNVLAWRSWRSVSFVQQSGSDASCFLATYECLFILATYCLKLLVFILCSSHWEQMSKPFLVNCPMVMLCNQVGHHCCWAASPHVGERDKLRRPNFFSLHYTQLAKKSKKIGSWQCALFGRQVVYFPCPSSFLAFQQTDVSGFFSEAIYRNFHGISLCPVITNGPSNWCRRSSDRPNHSSA